MEDRDVAAPRASGSENGRTSPRRSSSMRQREEVRLVSGRAQHVAHAPRAVADGVAAVRRRHPLVDDHRGLSGWGWAMRSRRLASGSRQRPIERRPELPQLLEPLELLELLPEVPGDFRRLPRRVRRAPRSTKRSSVPPKSLPRSRSSAASWEATTAASSAGSSRIAVHQLGDVERILGVVEHAAAVHRRRHRRGRVRQHRHALVERLDRSARRSPRARWRRGTGRRRRRAPSAPRSRRGRGSGRRACRAARRARCSIARYRSKPLYEPTSSRRERGLCRVR